MKMTTKSMCEYPFTRIRVTADGYVAPCCYIRESPITTKEEAYIGNLLENDFESIWFGDTMKEIRKECRKGLLHCKCNVSGCPYYNTPKPAPVREVKYKEYPTSIEIDLPNTHCNVGGINPNPQTSPACIMCNRSDPKFKPENNRLMEVLDKIKHIMPFIEHMHIQGIAEPFFQTRKDGFLLFDVLDKLNFQQYKNSIKISVTTNGILLRGSILDRYLSEIPMSITSFSLDASTPETYKKLRILDCFEEVLSNLKQFANKRNKSTQELRLFNNINTINVHEVTGIIRIASDVGVDKVCFWPTDGFNKRILVNEHNCGLFKKAQDEIIEECNKLNVSYEFFVPLDLGLTESLLVLSPY